MHETDPDEHVSRVREYIDLGFPAPAWATVDQERFIKLYGEEILPRLRALDA